MGLNARERKQRKMDQKQQMLDAAVAQAQAGQPDVLGVIQIALIAGPGGAAQIVVNSSIADLLQALGLLDMARDNIKQQAQQPGGSKLVRASGNVPRTSG